MKNFFQAIISFFASLFPAPKPSLPPASKGRRISSIPEFGDKSDDVLALQIALNEKGANPRLKEDKDFGPKTRDAVSAFQKKNGLSGSGIIGDKTLELLGLELVVTKLPEPQQQDPVPPAGIPTREEMLQVVLDLISGKIRPRIGFGYADIRETQGKNRSPALDTLIRRQGGALGDPYCQFGLQEMLDDLCAHYKINRKSVRLPEGGSTQSVFESTPKEFKHSQPLPMRWVTWRKGDSWRGHVGIVTGPVKNGLFQTFEFNTGPGPGVVRDGDGAFFKSRDLDGYGDMRLRGYIDVYQAVTEAMQPEVKINMA